MRAVVIGNSDDSDSGFVGERLRERGYVLESWAREAASDWPEFDPDTTDLVLLLGSAWSVYWEHLAEPVQTEAAVIHAAHGAGVPIFGICYGSQMLAHTLGGIVRRATEPEIGWYLIDSDRPAEIAIGPWMQWHSDIVELPPGATELARSAVGPQAWTMPGVLAVQFHPEVTSEMVTEWSASGTEELAAIGLTREELLERTAVETTRSRGAAHGLVDWFLATISTVRT